MRLRRWLVLIETSIEGIEIWRQLGKEQVLLNEFLFSLWQLAF